MSIVRAICVFDAFSAVLVRTAMLTGLALRVPGTGRQAHPRDAIAPARAIDGGSALCTLAQPPITATSAALCMTRTRAAYGTRVIVRARGRARGIALGRCTAAQPGAEYAQRQYSARNQVRDPGSWETERAWDHGSLVSKFMAAYVVLGEKLKDEGGAPETVVE